MTPVHCHHELWPETALQGSIQNLPLPLFDQNCFNLILRRLQCNTSACQDKNDQLGFFFSQPNLHFIETGTQKGQYLSAVQFEVLSPDLQLEDFNLVIPLLFDGCVPDIPCVQTWLNSTQDLTGEEKRRHILQNPTCSVLGQVHAERGIFNCDTQGHQSFNLASFLRILLSSSLSIIEKHETSRH